MAVSLVATLSFSCCLLADVSCQCCHPLAMACEDFALLLQSNCPLPHLPSLSMPRCDTRGHVHHIFLHSVHEVLPLHSLWGLGNLLWWRAFSTPLSWCLSRQQGRPSYLAGTQPVFGTHDPPVWLPQPHLQCNLAYKHCYIYVNDCDLFVLAPL